MAAAGDPLYKGASSGSVQTSDNRMRYRDFDQSNLFMVLEPDLALETSVRCTVQTKDGARDRKGAKTRFEGELLDNEFFPFFELPTRNKKTDLNGYVTIDFDLPDSLVLPPGPIAAFITATPLGGKRVTDLDLDCDLRSRQPCEPGTANLCLMDDRFKVEVEWQDFDATGDGIVFDSTGNEGLFFFTDPRNTELLVRLLGNCRFNDHFWVFYSATTDVGFELTVTDTQTGERKVYDNPLGTPANAIQDTSAFATCP